MADTSDRCQELLDEYYMLRRQLEEEIEINPDIDEAEEDEDKKDDQARLEELQELLEEECDIDVFAEEFEEETDLDIPEYAAESPSEPMEFDVE